MKKTIGLFVLVMLATAVGVFVALVLYNGPLAGVFAGPEVKAVHPSPAEERFAKEEAVHELFAERIRAMGVEVTRRTILPPNWREIVQTHVLATFPNPDKIRFEFWTEPPLRDYLGDSLPHPMIIQGWIGVVGIWEERDSEGDTINVQAYTFFINDAKLLYFMPSDDYKKMHSACFERLLGAKPELLTPSE